MNEPLAQRLRPKTLADVCGQQHLLAPGRVFRRTIESGRIPNMTFSVYMRKSGCTEAPIVLLCVAITTGMCSDSSFSKTSTPSFKKILSKEDSGSSKIKISSCKASFTR